LRFDLRSATVLLLLIPKQEAPMPDSPRIAPVEPPYDDDTAAMLQRWMPPNSDAEPLALFRTLAVHNDLAARMRPLGAGILGHGLLEPRVRELMIHRTCALCGAEYEWGVHAVAFGAPLGLSPEQLAATVHGSPEEEVWDERDRAVLRLADALHSDSAIGDGLFAQLRGHFDEAQIVELTVIAGWYHTISYVIAVARVPLEPWALRFPERAA
jgi:alkylhydroperoxidase family enzyme